MIKYLSSILLFSYYSNTISLEAPETIQPNMVIICLEDMATDQNNIARPVIDEEAGALDEEVHHQPNRHKHHSKLKMALVGLGSSIITAIVTLTIHFTTK